MVCLFSNLTTLGNTHFVLKFTICYANLFFGGLLTKCLFFQIMSCLIKISNTFSIVHWIPVFVKIIE